MKKGSSLLLTITIIILTFEVAVLSFQNYLLRRNIHIHNVIHSEVQSENQISLNIGDNVRELDHLIEPLTTNNNDNEKMLLDSSERKTRLLFIFSTTCQVCFNNLPVWNKLEREIADRSDVVALAISTHPRILTLPYAAKHNLSFPVFVAGEEFFRVFKVQSVPQTILISADGRVEKITVGPLTDAEAWKQYLK